MCAKYCYDLHTHSIYSDGHCMYDELARTLHNSGIEGFAVTDHNCAGPLEELEDIARRVNIYIIKGVEFAASLIPLFEESGIENKRDKRGLFEYERRIEILCYGLNEKSKEFIGDSTTHLNYRIQYFKCLCELISEIQVKDIRGLEHHKRKNEKLGNLYEKLLSLKYLTMKKMNCSINMGASEIICYLMDNFGLDKPAAYAFVIKYSQQAIESVGVDKHDPFYNCDFREMIQKTKRFGKVAVLAHPLKNNRKNLLSIYEQLILPAAKEAGLDGIERSYPEHTEDDEKIIATWKKRFRFSILTGGSDFHRPSQYKNIGNFGVDKETWCLLLDMIS